MQYLTDDTTQKPWMKLNGSSCIMDTLDVQTATIANIQLPNGTDLELNDLTTSTLDTGAITADSAVFSVSVETKELKWNGISFPLVPATPSYLLKVNGTGDGLTYAPDAVGAGDVVGPAVSVADNVATFSDGSGLAIKDSGVNLTLTNLSFPADFSLDAGATGRLTVDATSSQLKSPNTTTTLNLTDSISGMGVAGGVQFGSDNNSGQVYVQSFDNGTQLSLYNGQVDFYVSGVADSMLKLDATKAKLISPDGQSYCLVDDSKVQLGLDSQNLVQVDTNGVYLSGYNGQMDFSITNATNGLLVQDQTGARLEIKNSYSRLYPLDETKGYLELKDNEYKFSQDSGAGIVDREVINTTHCKLFSPDVSKTLTLNNTNLTANCAIVGSSLVAPSLDAGSAIALSIGGTNASAINVSKVGNLTTNLGNKLINGTLQAVGVLTLGTGASACALPAVVGSVGSILKVSATNTASWSQDASYSVNFGGNFSTNVQRWAIPASRFDGSTSTASDYSTRSIVPFDATIRAITYNTQSATATTQIIVSRSGVDVLTQLLAGASGIISALNIAFTAGQYIEIRWNVVGTRPDNSQFRVFFS